jgi:glutaredoxin 2
MNKKLLSASAKESKTTLGETIEIIEYFPAHTIRMLLLSPSRQTIAMMKQKIKTTKEFERLKKSCLVRKRITTKNSTGNHVHP